MYNFNAAQTRLVNRSNDLQHFLDQNEDIYSKVAPFAQQVNLLMSNNKTVASLSAAKGKNGKGSTKDKKDLKAEIVKEISSVCTFTSNYALNTNNNELYNAVHFTPSTIGQLRDAEVVGFVNNIVEAITPLLANPDFASYPVTADDLDTLTSNAASFKDLIGKGAMQNAASRIASRNINAVLKDIQGNINLLNGMVGYFKDDNPKFVQGYREATIVNNTGIRHSGIEGTVINSTTKEPIAGVTITLEGKTKTKTTKTNKAGVYQIEKFAVGNCTLTIAATGYESQAMDITILRSKTLEVNASLASQVIEFKTA